ncbi:hypothetical protein JCM17961_13990 [Endothiovibrio diazotrophicus]
MPAFAATARAVGGLARSDESSFGDLSQQILQDPGMTSRVLRRANSVYYRVAGEEIHTISRAVVVLGMEALASLCVSHSLVDSLQGGHQHQVVGEMARSFHAASQARGIARRMNDRGAEELFIATLLHQLGPIAFWSFAEQEAHQVLAAMKGGASREKAERSVLGFSLDELTHRLCVDWQLSSLVRDSLAGKESPRLDTIRLARQLASAAERGWDSAATREVLARIAEHTGMKLDDVREMAHAQAEEAAKNAAAMGAAEAGGRIPVAGCGVETLMGEEPAAPELALPDSALQMEFLSELTRMIAEGRADLNQLVGAVVEGVFRGIAMDRVLFAMLTPDRRNLIVRHALGLGVPAVGRPFSRLSPPRPDIFAYVLAKREPVWVNPADREGPFRSLIHPETRAVTGSSPFFAMAAMVNDRPIGLFYADRKGDGLPLDEASYLVFRQFCQQANMGLSLISGTRH